MKFFITLALFAAVASAGIVIPANLTPAQTAEIQEILDAINSPSTHPATAAALEQMLSNLLGLDKPADDYHPIQFEPALVDEDTPAVELPVIEFPIPGGAVDASPAENPAASNLPLVQIIVNVRNQTPGGPNPVQVVDGADAGVVATPVEVVEEAVNDYEPVLVMDPFPVAPEPVVVAPIVVEPAVVAPEILN